MMGKLTGAIAQIVSGGTLSLLLAQVLLLFTTAIVLTVIFAVWLANVVVSLVT